MFHASSAIGLFLIVLLVSAASCSTDFRLQATATVAWQGVIDCFEADNDPSAYCQASAAVYDGSSLIFASDSWIPCRGCSSVFSIAYDGKGPVTGPPQHFTADRLVAAAKYEDLSMTPDRRYVVATTAFDRVREVSADWDPYNTLLVWPAGSPGNARVIAPCTRSGITSSVALRENIARALKSESFPEGPPYFKIEGLAAVPGRRLLFGIREIGASPSDFAYCCTIISVSYTVADGEMTLRDDFRRVYSYDPSQNRLISVEIGLSGLEYDPCSGLLYMLTSYEAGPTDEGLGGYLWILPLRGLYDGSDPELVCRQDGTPLLFAHKAEGVAVLGPGRLLVAHDDDHVLGRETVENPETQFWRAANQAAYTILDIAWKPAHKQTE